MLVLVLEQKTRARNYNLLGDHGGWQGRAAAIIPTGTEVFKYFSFQHTHTSAGWLVVRTDIYFGDTVRNSTFQTMKKI